MTALAAKALELARAEIGTTEHPRGSNRGPAVDSYALTMGVEPDGAPWCARFVSAMVLRAAAALGAPKKFRGSSSCHRLVELNQDLWLTAPEPGCVFIRIEPDGVHGHCGFVESIAAGGALETVEGNSDAHGSRTGGSVVAGFRRPGYAQHFLAVG